jgi:tyrosyl-tRNA synthetase
MTLLVHSPEDLELAIEASEILFGKGTAETLKKLDESTFLNVFEGVPMFNVIKESLNNGLNIVDLLGEKTSIFSSKGEARKMIKNGGVSINKTRIDDEFYIVKQSDVLNDKFILVQKGKKNYYLLTCK